MLRYSLLWINESISQVVWSLGQLTSSALKTDQSTNTSISAFKAMNMSIGLKDMETTPILTKIKDKHIFRMQVLPNSHQGCLSDITHFLFPSYCQPTYQEVSSLMELTIFGTTCGLFYLISLIMRTRPSRYLSILESLQKMV